MGIFRKIKQTKALHAIEYSIILALVMAGIIIAGPYVIRSWNANLKGWDDSIQDSLQDPLLGAPPSSAPLEGCEAGNWVDQFCGAGSVDPCTGNTISCSAQEMLQIQSYSPGGCQCAIVPSPPPSIRCQLDPSCCEYIEGLCGVAGGCPNGQRHYIETCGGNPPTDVCGYVDPPGSNNFTAGASDPLCVFQCQIPPSKITAPTPYYGDVCTDDETGLFFDTPYVYVPDGGCTAAKCEIQCAPGAVVVGIPGTSCTCPPEKQGVDATGCPVGFVNQGACPPGQAVFCCMP